MDQGGIESVNVDIAFLYWSGTFGMSPKDSSFNTLSKHIKESCLKFPLKCQILSGIFSIHLNPSLEINKLF